MEPDRVITKDDRAFIVGILFTHFKPLRQGTRLAAE